MFWTEIHLHPDRHVLGRNDPCKNAMILQKFGSGSIFIFIDVCIDIYVMLSSDLYGTNRNLPYRTVRT